VQLHLPFSQDDAREQRPVFLEDTRPVVEFVRVRRARRYILRMRPDGSLRVTVPRGGSRREAEQFIQRQQRWIKGERRRVLVEHCPREWQHGSEILLNGEAVRIAVESRGDETIIAFGNRQIVTSGTAHVRSAIEEDLRALARVDLTARLRQLADQYGLRVGAVSIRDQRTRWGSCARNGNIALNFRLVQMPPEVRDYVLVHELMHIKQQNHSRRFWRLVAAAYPAFREAERWLRTTGKSLF
jgi:predicted metal-dependent hydrolase